MNATSRFSESDTLDLVRVQMKQFGEVLDTRKGGNKARLSIEQEILSGSLGAAVVLDFRGVRAATVSFIDECIGVLLANHAIGYYGNHPVLALNANEDVRETIAVTLAHRKLALLHLMDPPELLGGDEILNQTLREAWNLGKFTAGDLAGNMGISPQAVNNRLKALFRRGALHRMLIIPPKGGKEFVYTIPEGVIKKRRPAKKIKGSRERIVPANGG
jgi:STAS-like domain of unknown function (DUF4325)